MRALHFGRFYNDQFGGLERHVDALLRGLKAHCEADNLVAHDHWAHTVIATESYTVYKTPSLGKVAGTALCPAMPGLARALHRERGYDLVHLHLPDPMAHLAAAFLPKSVKRVITWHSDIVRQKQLLKLYKPFLGALLNRVDAIIVPTPAHISSSSQLGACRRPERCHVVPFGIEYGMFDKAAQQHQKIADLRASLGGGLVPLIFTVGRHVYYKGLEYLIRAMIHVPQSILVIGGDGPLTSDLRAMSVSLGLEARVRFVGRISDAELPFYYHACDVFCMPSVAPAEAFGLVQLEAMACGKPVVCCELYNGVTYVNRHGETGLVVPPRDPEALAEVLNRLLNDPGLRVRLGEQGRRRARAEFSVESMVAGTLDVYRSVLQTAARSDDSVADVAG
ncbi:MAG: glycosyltransferase [Gammaproteobacteria bacterium]|nr:glycosyltransferase [Gammaproteobacteria bacterium]